MADWTKNFTAHDWSQMRTTWQTNRDSRHVPKGAGGNGVSIGDALKRVGAAQAKGLSTFLKELAQLEGKLAKYKTAITPKAAKPPKGPKDPNYKGFADWIKNDLEAWIKADKEAAKNEAAALRETLREFTAAVAELKPRFRAELDSARQESAKAQGASSTDGLPFVKEDVARVTGVFDAVTTALDKMDASCAAATKAYGTHAPQALASALSKMQAEIKEVNRFIDDLTKHSEWEGVLIEAKGMELVFRGVVDAQGLVLAAAKARVA